jgi:hypothetical protein
VNGRNALNWSDRFRLDVEYVRNYTFWGDVKIFFKTIKRVATKSDVLVGAENTMPAFDEERRAERGGEDAPPDARAVDPDEAPREDGLTERHDT